MPSPRVLVLYNEPVLPRGHPLADSEAGVLKTVRNTSRALRQAGYTVRTRGVGENPETLLEGLREARPDAVFNLFEGLATQPGTEATVVGLLEWLAVPFTGSPSAALSLALDKHRTKQLLRGAGLPTPASVAVDRLPPDWPLGWPAIVKPARQDASVGIEQASVVSDPDQLERRCAWVLERFGPPALVEQFIPGREFHVHLIEDVCDPDVGASCLLHVAEVLFLEQAPGYWPIYSYDAKWTEASTEYEATPLQSPVVLGPDQLARLAELARGAYDLIGCRDYARLDLRMTPDGDFTILEVNPNPNLSSKLIGMALEEHGRTYADLAVGLVGNALARAPKPPVARTTKRKNRTRQRSPDR
jgi:D-alanine-D-alanine ligase